MAFPVLVWDADAGEPACTGCMACVNYCPSSCMSATVAPNPRRASGESQRKTIATSFAVDLPRCIECGICVEVCRYGAIELAYHGPASAAGPNGVADMPRLLELGRLWPLPAAAFRRRPSELLAEAQDRLPPASASDGARRARSRLRNTQPVRVDISKKPGP